MMFIDLKTQSRLIKKKYNKKLDDIITNARFINGIEVEEFEKQSASFLGYSHGVGVSSGTDALLITMLALGVNSKTKVFLPAFTYTASAEAICLLGAKPVFVDVDKDTFLISAIALKKSLQKHSVPGDLIMPVDLFGYPCDYDELAPLAQEFGVKIFVDGAQGFGSKYKGKSSFIGIEAFCTSFFPAKPLGCFGDGGAIYTDNLCLFNTLKSIRNHGMGDNKYDIKRVGVNGRLDTIQAAALSCKLEIFEEELSIKRNILSTYNRELAKLLTPQTTPYSSLSACAQATFLLPEGIENAEFANKMKEHDIPTMIYYPKTVAEQTAYSRKGILSDGLTTSNSLTKRSISFPFHAYLSNGDVEKVIEKTIHVINNEF